MAQVYCTRADIFDAVRVDVLYNWAKDDSRENDALAEARIDQAIVRATDEINLYIGKAVSLPLVSVPQSITDIAVRIAIYKVASRRGIMAGTSDETVRQNYEDALIILQHISAGKASLGIDTSGTEIPTASTATAAHFPPSRMDYH